MLNHDQRPFAIALAVSLLLHAVLLWAALRWKPPAKPRPPLHATLKVEVAPPRPTPVPKQPPPPEPIKTPKPTPRPAPPPPQRHDVLAKSAPAPVAVAPPVPTPEPQPPGPPQHRMKSSPSAAPAGASGGRRTGGPVYAPPEYAEKVKARVNAAIVYPADSKRFLQQCWVEYTLVIDRNGNMLGMPKIENCGDDRLDATALAALYKGQPYPPPPDSGANSYEIHGALVFTLR